MTWRLMSSWWGLGLSVWYVVDRVNFFSFALLESPTQISFPLPPAHLSLHPHKQNTAYNLARNGKKVALVDARTRCSGQTGNTSAHIMEWLDDFYFTVEEKFNTESMAKVAKSMNLAIDFIEDAVKHEKLKCEFRRVPGYLVSSCACWKMLP